MPLYFVKGYGFTGIQYTIFLILAIQGYIAWKKSLDNKKPIL
ncbi:MAG: nicotinamide mononucleotide transporter [Aureibaculum sp.]